MIRRSSVMVYLIKPRSWLEFVSRTKSGRQIVERRLINFLMRRSEHIFSVANPISAGIPPIRVQIATKINPINFAINIIAAFIIAIASDKIKKQTTRKITNPINCSI